MLSAIRIVLVTHGTYGFAYWFALLEHHKPWSQSNPTDLTQSDTAFAPRRLSSDAGVDSTHI